MFSLRVAQAWLITLFDAVWVFNHIKNTRRARKALAVIALSGVYQPFCLPFGPLKGPEDFQRIMHNIYSVVPTGFNHHLTVGELATALR